MLFDEALPPASGDGGRLHQVVWNLLSNAVKFTEPGGDSARDHRHGRAVALGGQARCLISVGKEGAMLFLAAVALAAQTTATAAEPKSSTAASGEKITVTGCVERADQMNGAGTTVGTTIDSLHFVLVNIPAAPVGTSGAKGAAAPAMDKGYRLDGDVDALNRQVGHKVEITGFVDAPAATSGPTTSVNGPMVKVQTIKMLSETCGR
jgi:hypothetical protein